MAQPFVNVLPAGLWVAKDRGFFRKYGIDLDIVIFRGSTQAMQAVLAGQVNLMVGSPGQGLSAAAAGSDIIGVATIGAQMPYFFVVRPDLKTAADLKGKSIGISGTGLSASRLALILALRQLGLDAKRDNITLLSTGTVPERIAALRSGSIAGTVVDRTSQPIESVKDLGLTILADFSKLGIPWEHDIVMTTRRFASGNPKLTEDFMKAWMEGNAYVLNPQNKRYVLRIIAQNLKYDKVSYAEAVYTDAVANFVYKKPYIKREALVTLVEIAKDEFPALLKVNLDQFIDHSILQRLDRSGFIDTLYKR
jgi:NitT/TauT family transport system substrate-binding protein